MKRPDKEIGKVLHEKSGTYPSQYHDTILAYIAHLESQLQPRKTVSDAVDYFDGVWPEKVAHINIINWNPDKCDYFFSGRPSQSGCQVCTRQEFEAEVERRKGDIAAGEMPELIEGDQLDNTGIWFKGAAWYLDGPDALQQCHSSTLDSVCLIRRAGKVIWKRKSSISKAEAWDRLVKEMEDPRGKFAFSAFYDILEQFKVK